jgi:DNA repair protein SbcC/Rad50
MFIDEGFGTLDAETLDVVIDALERPRDSERMVGVITHVSQLAERIPDGLAVEREGATSRIRPR